MSLPLVHDLVSAAQAIPGPWQPRVAGDVNDHQVKIARFEGAFDWHCHAGEDEAFLVLEGRIAIDFRDGTIELGRGEFATVPRGTEHRPRSIGDTAVVVLFEPASTINTGAVVSPRTLTQLENLALGPL